MNRLISCFSSTFMPAIVAILLGGVCATAVGILFGIPSLRIKGLYLSLIHI